MVVGVLVILFDPRERELYVVQKLSCCLVHNYVTAVVNLMNVNHQCVNTNQLPNACMFLTSV